MSKKFSAARKRAFLQYLAETGNQTIAAERAKVSRSWICLHRSGDAEFDGACREAIEVAKSALRDSPLTGSGLPQDERSGSQAARLGKKWKYLDGVELVVRGTNGRRTQIARARLKQWTPRVEERFLAALAATCNVKAACAEVGMFPGSAYGHRHRWPAFATRWDQAVATGYARIEEALVEAGSNLFSEPDFPLDNPIGPMTASQALHLLHMHKRLVYGGGHRPGYEPYDEGEIRQRIERKLEVLRRGYDD